MQRECFTRRSARGKVVEVSSRHIGIYVEKEREREREERKRAIFYADLAVFVSRFTQEATDLSVTDLSELLEVADRAPILVAQGYCDHYLPVVVCVPFVLPEAEALAELRDVGQCAAIHVPEAASHTTASW